MKTTYAEISRLMLDTRIVLGISDIPSGLIPWVAVHQTGHFDIGDRQLLPDGFNPGASWIALCRSCDRSALTCIYDPCQKETLAR